MKLFEIPVYGLTKEVLKKRVEERRIRLTKEARLSHEDLKDERIIQGLSVYPKDQWAYNHIVGFIEISYEKDKITLNWYTTTDLKSYRWESTKKRFLQPTRPSGHHFYIGNIKSGDEFRNRLHELLHLFIQDLKNEHSGYYVDLEVFNNIDKLVDYSRLL